MVALNIVEERRIGEIRRSKINMVADLDEGQSISSVTWSIEAGSGITLVAASNDIAIGQEGRASVVRGNFDYSAAVVGQWTLTAIAVCATPTETKVDYAVVQVVGPPV